MATGTLNTYQSIIENVLQNYISRPYGQFTRKLVIDRKGKDFLVLMIGWQGYSYIHNCIIHIEIVDDKIWVQADNTEDGITYALLEAGIPKSQIVLGFQSPFERSLTEFATG
jgi:hypothetical protein